VELWNISFHIRLPAKQPILFLITAFNFSTFLLQAISLMPILTQSQFQPGMLVKQPGLRAQLPAMNIETRVFGLQLMFLHTQVLLLLF